MNTIFMLVPNHHMVNWIAESEDKLEAAERCREWLEAWKNHLWMMNCSWGERLYRDTQIAGLLKQREYIDGLITGLRMK